MSRSAPSRSPCGAAMRARLPRAAALVGSIFRTEEYRRFASSIEPRRCAVKAFSSNCSGFECPTFWFCAEEGQHLLALPIVGVLDIETRRSIHLHINDGAGQPDLVNRAWAPEQS